MTMTEMGEISREFRIKLQIPDFGLEDVTTKPTQLESHGGRTMVKCSNEKKPISNSKYGLFFPCRRERIMAGVDLGDVPQEPELKLGDDFYKEEPVYDAQYKTSFIENGWAMKANRLDVTTFLTLPRGREYLVTNDGSHVPLESLRGSFVLIACFHAPVSSECSQFCRTLISLSEYFSKRGVHTVRVVIVAKMRQKWAHNKDAFNHFFSGFPPDFLAIPFSDPSSRDCVAKSLGLSSLNFGFAAVVVDPYQNVLAQQPIQLLLHGAASFPFSPFQFHLLDEHDRALRHRLDSFSSQFPPFNPASTSYDASPISLVQLLNLCCPEANLPLLRISGPRLIETAPLSVLDGKLVALYLCFDGSSMECYLNSLQQLVKDSHAQLEVVLVPLSFMDHTDVFLDHVTLALHKYGISSWWALPYHDILCHTLWRVTGWPLMDRLLLLPFQDCYSGDIKAFARALVRTKTTYSFARHLLYSIRLFTICKIDFWSLLGTEYTEFPWGGVDQSPFPVERLRDMNILLYLDTFQSGSHSQDMSDLLQKYFIELQLEFPNFLLVCVPTMGPPESGIISKYAGLVLPTQVANSVSKALFLEDLGECRRNVALVSVGKNGRLLSRMAEEFLHRGDVNSLFNWNLDQEIAREVENEVEDMAPRN